MPASVFINYRRDDSLESVKDFKKKLEAQLGPDTIFLDESIALTEYWAPKLKTALRQAEVVLSIIGPRWLDYFTDASPLPKIDWVQFEIETAQQEGIDIIPVFLNREKNIVPDHLPENVPASLKKMLAQQGIVISPGSFDASVYSLALGLQVLLKGKAASEGWLPLRIPLLEQLPLPPHFASLAQGLPAPYLGPRHFTEQEAALYFGRERDIRNLFHAIRKNRITLLHGYSGTGKSSLLYAGLLPRLQSRSGFWRILEPQRRDKALGGLAVQLNTLLAMSNPVDNKAVLISLDQVEEIFTDPGTDGGEMDNLLALVTTIIDRYPQAHLILAFRSDYFSRIKQALVEHSLYTHAHEVYLPPLKKPELIKAVTGPANEPFFNLCFESDQLPEQIAENIMQDGEGIHTPLLQIQMLKIWEAAALQRRDPNKDQIVITEALYRQNYQQNLSLFLEGQLEILNRKGWSEYLQNGLVTDILFDFTTELGTATAQFNLQLTTAFDQPESSIEQLLQALKDTYLLIDYPGREKRTRLAHDALAPIVRAYFFNSDALAQRSRRIVESKLRDIDKDFDVTFSDYDIQLIRRGQPYMRRIPANVEGHLKKSESIILQRQAELIEKNYYIFKTLCQSAKDSLLRVEPMQALSNIQAALEVNVDFSVKRESLFDDLYELVFLFSESTRYYSEARAVLSVFRLFLDDESIGRIVHRCLTKKWENREQFKTLLKRINAGLYEALLQKYYPEMIAIEGGKFLMGSENSGLRDEMPCHPVKVSSFKMAASPVTFFQFGIYCLAVGRNISAHAPSWGLSGYDPVVNVMWYEAIEYVNWLSIQRGYLPALSINKLRQDPHNQAEDPLKWLVTPRTDGTGFRLPTEAEWEFAAKGGSHRLNYLYIGSDTLEEVGWFWKNSGDQYIDGPWSFEATLKNNCRGQSVKKKKANQLGLYDMSGNVFEWCWDWYGEDYYTACQNQGLVFDPHGPPQGKNKVLRGGAWNAQDYACKTTYRDYALAFYRSNNYGFRIVQVEDF